MKVFYTGMGVLISSLLLGCGSSSNSSGTIDPAATTCAANSAAILVGDGFLKTLCGCSGAGESNGTVFSAPGNLTCHLATRNMTVFFYFLGTVLKHQVAATGSNKFVSSPVSDPNSNYPIRSYAVSLNQISTSYGFVDVFSGMVGTIIVP